MTSQVSKNSNTILYDQDFCLWIDSTVKQIQEQDFENIDWNNLLEEIESMGKREKNALESNLTILLMHLLKWQYQSDKRSNSWAFTITEHNRRIKKAFKQSPSLKLYFQEVFAECYGDGGKVASRKKGLPIDTSPKESPFNAEDVLKGYRIFD